jgi:hypothetical protein
LAVGQVERSACVVFVVAAVVVAVVVVGHVVGFAANWSGPRPDRSAGEGSTTRGLLRCRGAAGRLGLPSGGVLWLTAALFLFLLLLMLVQGP